LQVLSQIDSTNEEVRRNLTLPEGAVFIADQQTHGRGRQGRSWHSEAGTGLYLSTLLKPNLPPEKLALITLMAGVATVSAIQQQIPSVPLKLKWPNDILLNGKKLAGILCEYIPGTAVIVGIGINLNQTCFPEAIQTIATSLKLETGSNINRTDIVISLLENLNSTYDEFLQEKRTGLIKKWTNKTDMFGKTTTVYQKGKSLTGTAMGLDPEGRLILRTEDGKKHALSSGELMAIGPENQA
jgi:BirA family transcriptional regulator, biotin operon repressor / biotin---[acetyl-CoA-carboxylase] ligase